MVVKAECMPSLRAIHLTGSGRDSILNICLYPTPPDIVTYCQNIIAILLL